MIHLCLSWTVKKTLLQERSRKANQFGGVFLPVHGHVCFYLTAGAALLRRHYVAMLWLCQTAGVRAARLGPPGVNAS